MGKAEKAEQFSEITSELLRKTTARGAQYFCMLRRLCESTQKWAEEHDDDLVDYETKLSNLSSYLDKLQEALNYDLWTLNRDAEKRSLTDEEEKKREKWNQKLWDEQDPVLIFQHGLEKLSYRRVLRSSLESLIADYFSKPWMKNGELEFWFVSALVLDEIVYFGEAVKKRIAAVGSSDSFGRRQIYMHAKGDLIKMNELAAKYSFRRAMLVFVAVGAVVFASAVLKMFGVDNYLMQYGCYGGVGYLVVQSVVADRKMKRLEKEQVLLWDKMHDVWLTLRGEVVNPTILKQKLDESAAKGAVWNNLVYSFVGIWIRRHSQVFFVDGKSVTFE